VNFWVLALPLLAAVLHAGWNALVKTAPDRLLTIAAIALTTSLLGLGMIPFLDQPSRASWHFIAASSVLHYVYYILIYFAYRAGDLSLVYPLARGAAPLLVLLGATAFAGEVLPFHAQLGIVVACIGISTLSFSHFRGAHASPTPIFLALGTAVTIAAYTVCDGMGVRMSGSPLGYTAWLFALELPVALFVIFRRRQGRFRSLIAHWRHGAAAGASSAVAYGLVIYAYAFAPMAIVSALRETSVIIAALIGTVLMNERPWQERIAASSMVACGIALMTAFG
jgi:drug/metabolite transporter (DMT)-like permease